METIIGYIFSPERPKYVINSVRLEISDYGIYIEIGNRRLKDKYDILLGGFNGIGDVTLIDCNFYGKSSGHGGEVIRLDVKYLLKGRHINRLEDLVFEKCNVSFPRLKNWLGISIINFGRRDGKKIFTIDNPSDIEIGEISNVKLSLGFGYFFNVTEGNTNIKQNSYLKISSKKKISFYNFLDKIQTFKKFLIFVANLSPESESIVFYSEDLVYDPEIEELNTPVAIELLTANSAIKYDETWYSPNVKYGQIKNQLPKIYNEWFNNSDLVACIDLLLEKSYNPRLSRENYFLNSCFSIETFHRRFRNFEIFKKSDFRDLKSKIKAVIDNPDIFKFIDEKLAHANEPTFRSRLLDIKSDFRKLLPDHYDVEDYIGKIVKTRNFLVHRGSNKEIIEGLELFYAAKYIDTIVKINVFRLIGITEDIIENELKYSKNYIHQMYIHNKLLQKSLKDQIM